MDRIELTNLGGFPLEQDTLNFIQNSFRQPLSALARLAGDKTILYGVEVIGGNVTPGWISYGGELILFQGGVAGVDVVIAETPTQITFEDETIHEAYFVKVAQCGVGGVFPFADLVPLLSLQNMWRPGDVKERICDAAYIATNFDVDGYGLNAEKGWRILSKAYPETAGKVMVNLDPADTDFDAVGKTIGEKKHTLTPGEFSHSISIPRGDAYTGDSEEAANRVGGGQGTSTQTSIVIKVGNSNGVIDAHNNLQPSYAILKLVKL